jgi:hypothetical protein
MSVSGDTPRGAIGCKSRPTRSDARIAGRKYVENTAVSERTSRTAASVLQKHTS